MVDRNILVDKANECAYNFQNFRSINTFGREIYDGKITLEKLIKIKVIY